MGRAPEFRRKPDSIGPEFKVRSRSKSFWIDDDKALRKSIAFPSSSFNIQVGRDHLTVDLSSDVHREFIDARVKLPHGRGPNGKTTELLGNVSALLLEVASLTGKPVEFNLITDNHEMILWAADPNRGRRILDWDEIGHLKSGKVCAVKRIEPLPIPSE